MDLVFLDNSTVRTDKTRKLIRSRCMIGKNVGKQRSKRTNAEKSNKSQAVIKPSPADWTYYPGSSVFADRFAHTHFPLAVDARMHELLYRCML
jgi:hypothetical protein